METLRWNFSRVKKALLVQDPALGALLQQYGKLKIEITHDYFQALCRSIIGQQVSVKAAQSIYEKLLTGMEGKLTPAQFVQCRQDDLRPFGLSRQKATYLIDLATHFMNDPAHFGRLNEMSDEEVIHNLVQVKGIGVWTAQMFLMFVLGRPDVFAPDDLGLRNAMMKLYGWKTTPDRKKMTRVAERWRPYRTYACRYLWRSLHNELVK